MDEHWLEVFERPGRVKWFDTRKGYGFINLVGPACEVVGLEGADIAVHYSIIQGPGYRLLRDGQAVRFDAVCTDKGWKATRVERVEGDWPDGPDGPHDPGNPRNSGDPGMSGVGAVPKRPPGYL